MSVRNSLKHGSKRMRYFHLVNVGGYFLSIVSLLVLSLSRLCLNLKSKTVCMYHRLHTYIKVCSLLKMCVSALDLTLLSYLHFLVGVLLLLIMPEETENAEKDHFMVTLCLYECQSHKTNCAGKFFTNTI